MKKIALTLMTVGILGTNMFLGSSAVMAEENNNINKPLTEVTTIQPREAGLFTITADIGANMRSGPGMNYSIIKAFPKGTQFARDYGTVNGGWWKVVLLKNGKLDYSNTGYIHESTGISE